MGDKSSKVKFNPTMILHGEGGLKNHNKENNKDDNMQKHTNFLTRNMIIDHDLDKMYYIPASY